MNDRIAKWRVRNTDRAMPLVEVDEPRHRTVAGDLERTGIALSTFDGLFSSASWSELAAAADDTRSRHEDPRPTDNTKPFKAHLLEGPIRAEDPFARVALDEGVLRIAARYLGMHPLLRALDIWLTFPTPGPPVETQLWHRDGDDVMNVKLFIYLTAVTDGTGPFCYAPRTHPLGDLRGDPPSNERGRSDDAQMGTVVPPTDWLVCTGGPGTVILSDTCGYHKQLKPLEGQRVLLMAQYTSGRPAHPPDVEIVADPTTLSELQRSAIATPGP